MSKAPWQSEANRLEHVACKGYRFCKGIDEPLHLRKQLWG